MKFKGPVEPLPDYIPFSVPSAPSPSRIVTADRSECPICGDWRDSPTADCANCGYDVRPCGDVLGLCVYAGPHDGQHLFGRPWRERLAALPVSPTDGLDAAWAMVERSLPKGSPEWDALIHAATLVGRNHLAARLEVTRESV